MVQALSGARDLSTCSHVRSHGEEAMLAYSREAEM